MATVIPVDEFISDEWYPGFDPDRGRAPWCVDPVRTFRKEDGSAIGVDDPREIGQRARRLEQTLPGFLRDFEPTWGRMREEIDQGWDYFRGLTITRP